MEKINQTRQWMIDALLTLMKSKKYNDITISEITDRANLGRRTFYRYFKSKDDILNLYCEIIIRDFGEKILEKKEITLYAVTLSYFEFWTAHVDFLNLLREVRMLSFIEERIETLAINLAVSIGHAAPDTKYDKSIIYEFIFKVAGYWRVTVEWSSHIPRESPEEITQIVTDIFLPKTKSRFI